MPPRQLTLDELRGMVGQELGLSGWHTITQEDITTFANVTGDRQWIHTDPERARKETPFGGTIAHGYYTLSLAPGLISQMWTTPNVAMAINYGLNKLRFPAPTPVGGQVRLRAGLTAVDAVEGGVQLTVALTFELEGSPKPVCVAEALYRYYL